MADINVTEGALARDEAWARRGFRLSWGAVWAGFLVATVLRVMLTLFGVAVGFFGWNPGDPLASLGTGAIIWAIIVGMISLFVGGLINGRLAGVLTRGDGAMHGAVMWALSTLLAVWIIWRMLFFLLGSALGIVGGAVSSTAGAVVGGVAQAGAAAVSHAGGINLPAIRREVDQALRQTGNPALRPESLRNQAAQVETAAVSPESNQTLANDIANEIQRTAGQVRREDLVNLVAARTNLSRPEAERLVDRVQAAASSAQQQVSTAVDTLGARAQHAAVDVKHALMRLAWVSLLAMILSLLAAVAGTSVTARS